MSDAEGTTWYEFNQRRLMEALEEVRALLERHAARSKTAPEKVHENDAHGASQPSSPPETASGETDVERAEVQVAAWGQEFELSAGEQFVEPPATGEDADTPRATSTLDSLCAIFNLSTFERDVLLMCAGIELDAAFGALCGAAHGDPRRNYPTFSLALAALRGAHWSALIPAAPLRRWRLVEVGTGDALTLSPLRIDERVLHYLAGVQHLDERLSGIIEPLRQSVGLVPSHHDVAARIVNAWTQTTDGTGLPVVQLCGDETAGKRAIAAHACSLVGLNLCLMSAQAMPTSPGEVEALVRLWDREAALSSTALLIDCDDLESSDAARARAVNQFVEHVRGALIILSGERRHIRERTAFTLDVRKPEPREQSAVWGSLLGASAPELNGEVETLVSQFNLSMQAIHAAGSEALGRVSSAGDGQSIGAAELRDVLWDTCRMQSRPRLDDLAQRIEPAATWEDLVLPEAQTQILCDIAAHVRQRATVYGRWGFANKGARGLGISALFAGASGTGKTMAAEVLAGELRLDLYRIDLSSVVSKYIGETEKNLKRVFDAAEDGGSILLFDEADALFGKRSEVKDSHDRYANIEVSYLLQRMEAYRGLAILTTNLRNALDTAFLRRIRFVVPFPFPDAAQRALIWRRIFPPETPTENLSVEKLARLNLAGGNIRNIALNAAFLAADAGEPVRMSHLLRASQSEYAKLEKPLTETETRGWV